jgi:hypothetical protein
MFESFKKLIKDITLVNPMQEFVNCIQEGMNSIFCSFRRKKVTIELIKIILIKTSGYICKINRITMINN